MATHEFWDALLCTLEQFPKSKIQLEAASSWDEAGAFLTITLVAGAAFDSCRVQLSLTTGTTTEVSVLDTSSGSDGGFPEFVIDAVASANAAAAGANPGPAAVRTAILRLCDELNVDLSANQSSLLGSLGLDTHVDIMDGPMQGNRSSIEKIAILSEPSLNRKVSNTSSAGLSFETQEDSQLGDTSDDDLAIDVAATKKAEKDRFRTVSASDDSGPTVEDVIIWDAVVENLKKFPGDRIKLVCAGSWDGVEGFLEICLSPGSTHAEWARLFVMVIAGSQRTSVQLKGAQVVPDGVRAAIHALNTEAQILGSKPSSIQTALQVLCDCLQIDLCESGRSALDCLANRENFASLNLKPTDEKFSTSLNREAAAVSALQKQLEVIDFQVELVRGRQGESCETQTQLDHELVKLLHTHARVKAECEAAGAAMRAALRECTQTHGDAKAPLEISVTIADNPAQSLRGHSIEGARREIITKLNMSGPWGHYAAHQFSLMLAREQELHSDYICFYHSYSLSALIYEVHAEIVRYIYDLPSSLAPIPRISKAGNNICRTLDDLKRMGGQDGRQEFQALGLSVSCSLFASGSEAPPLNCFMQGYSAGACSWRGLLQKLIEILGGSVDTVDKVVDAAKRNGLCVNGYASPGAGYPNDRMELTGYMLQVFIHRSIVEKFAYPSEPYGRQIAGSMVDYVEKRSKADGQARILFDPDLLMADAWKLKLFHYCARPLQSCMAPEVAQSRGAFLRELHQLLGPLLQAVSKETICARLTGSRHPGAGTATIAPTAGTPSKKLSKAKEADKEKTAIAPTAGIPSKKLIKAKEADKEKAAIAPKLAPKSKKKPKVN